MSKLTPLQISLGLSLLCHLAVIGGYELFKAGTRPPALQQTDDIATLTLVAAPDEPAAPVVQVLAPAEPLKKLPEKNVPVETAQPPKPEPEPVLSTPPPVATAAAMPPPPEIFQSDASSSKPGPDAVTVQAQPAVEAKPNYLKNPDPVYPELARRRHQEGLVLLDVTVTTRGHVAQIKLKKSSGFALLDDAALQAVSNWEFEPARLGPLALESEITVPVRFELRR
ncbi:MAG TPA: energy transducer TonB [Candidatus Sulfotelmatobacter sp.]|jgi:protein TonB|nr:energy transducer TonB [Candidatus Sulfotelmatobacter sp.]